MAKNVQIDISDVFNELKDRIALESSQSSEIYVPNIIEFCESKRYLNLGKDGISLFPMQKIILKSFYRGQPGNEYIGLTEEELSLLHQSKMDKIVEKYRSGSLFRELILVLGRRSGKDFMTSLIALYEAMKLLECPGGSPFQYYDMATGNPIYILTVATSSDQARILYLEIKTRIQLSEYFRSRIGKIEADRIYLLTPEDKEKNKKLEENGLGAAKTPGSVIILSGHSNSEGLLGKRIFCLLLDEVASFKATGTLSGERIYSALTPATADFKTPGKIKPGSITPERPEGLPMYDSKIVSISSPRAEEGILHRMYKEAGEVPERLAFKAPTWKVNLKFTEDSLRHEFKLMSPVEFEMEFGAEFSGTGGELFIPPQYVDDAIEIGRNMHLTQRITGTPGMVYYAHLDPAATSHNYALAILHVEERVRTIENPNGIQTQEKFKMFIVDHLKFWRPSGKESIVVGKVDQYIIDLAKRFRFAMVSYDAFNSLASIQKLRSKGIPSKLTEFRSKYKMQIYQHLEHLLVNHQLALPPSGPGGQLLEQELKHLKRIFNSTGFKIQPDPEAPVHTDDLCDAIAGAIGVALESTYAGYAKGGTVYLPQSRGIGESNWKIGSGSYSQQQWKNMYGKFGRPFG